MKRLLLLITVLLALPLQSLHAQSTTAAGLADTSDTYERATVLSIQREYDDNTDGFHRTVQEVTLHINTGPDTGKEIALENGILDNREDMRLHEGEQMVVERLQKVDGSVEYQTREKYRLPAIIFLFVLFLVLTVVLGGITGFTSILGLLASIAILVFYVVPQVASGANPLIVSLIGSCAIACTSLYLAHGFHYRTTVSLISTLVTLVLAVLTALFFVHVGKLFGMGSEESMYLQMGTLGQVNLQGLLLGGIVIGCLGVLDDVTTAQTAAIDEIRKANPSLSQRALRAAGMSVGKEHIASLINTLALAYVGASLPLLLLFKTQGDVPLWITLNSEFLSEEIVRTLVGSATLLFAVPISTWFAVRLLPLRPPSPGHGHSHAHGHVHLS